MAGDDREPASVLTSRTNALRIARERNPYTGYHGGIAESMNTTEDLRDELRRKGLRGFRRGGPVHRTGIYRLHRGEYVVPARKRRVARRK